MLIKNKKASDMVPKVVIFILLNLMFIVPGFIFISRLGTGDDFFEKKEVRRIALSIDELKPGSTLTIYADELFERAKKNNFKGEAIVVNYTSGYLALRVKDGSGNNFLFFNSLESGSIFVDPANKIIIVKK